MSETQANAGELFHAGRLAEAVTAAGAAVRQAPGDLGGRVLLAEMLVFALMAPLIPDRRCLIPASLHPDLCERRVPAE